MRSAPRPPRGEAAPRSRVGAEPPGPEAGGRAAGSARVRAAVGPLWEVRRGGARGARASPAASSRSKRDFPGSPGSAPSLSPGTSELVGGEEPYPRPSLRL